LSFGTVVHNRMSVFSVPSRHLPYFLGFELDFGIVVVGVVDTHNNNR